MCLCGAHHKHPLPQWLIPLARYVNGCLRACQYRGTLWQPTGLPVPRAIVHGTSKQPTGLLVPALPWCAWATYGTACTFGIGVGWVPFGGLQSPRADCLPCHSLRLARTRPNWRGGSCSCLALRSCCNSLGAVIGHLHAAGVNDLRVSLSVCRVLCALIHT